MTLVTFDWIKWPKATMCLNPINIKATALQGRIHIHTKNASIKTLIIHFSHWFHCIRLNYKKNCINWFYMFFFLSFYIPFYSRDQRAKEGKRVLLKIHIIRFKKWLRFACPKLKFYTKYEPTTTTTKTMQYTLTS